MRRVASSRRLLLGVALVAAVAGAVALRPALAALGKARAADAALTAALAVDPPPPRPLLPPGRLYRGSERRAGAALAAAVRDLAVQSGVLLERDAALPPPLPGLVLRHIALSGSPAALLRLVERIEARAPLVRLPRYRLESGASAESLRLEGDLAMAYAPA